MKQILDMKLTGKRQFLSGGCLMTFVAADGSWLPDIRPGQFVEIDSRAHGATLRRPISVCDVRYGRELVLYVKPVGKGTEAIVSLEVGGVLSMVLPLGHGFTDGSAGQKVLLAGGGVGCAPLLLLARRLKDAGADVTVALGGRTASEVLDFAAMFSEFGSIVLCTDDGSVGHHGLITTSDVFSKRFDRTYVCGPTPMMKAVVRICAAGDRWCEVSLENHMACGLGACLCCVEKTSDAGNVCVCTEGPVFNINRLKTWL